MRRALMFALAAALTLAACGGQGPRERAYEWCDSSSGPGAIWAITGDERRAEQEEAQWHVDCRATVAAMTDEQVREWAEAQGRVDEVRREAQ